MFEGFRQDRGRESQQGIYLKNSLPRATFVELLDEFVPIWLTHSEEEIAMFRKAALGCEVATEAFIEAVKPRANLGDLTTALADAVFPYGLSIGLEGSLYTGPEGGRGSRWQGRGVSPPVIKKGHLVHTEKGVNCGHMGSQMQITVSVGEPSKEIAQLGRLAREAYEIGIKKIRPGVTFGEVCEAMAEPNRRESAWNLTPHLHTMNPNEAVSMMREGIWENYTGLKERLGEAKVFATPTYRSDLVLREGMTFAFEPNSCFGRTYVNIAGGAICTKDGCEEVNDLPNRLIVVDA